VRRGAAVLALLLVCTAVATACKEEKRVDRDAELKKTLTEMRGAIDRFRQDNQRYPRSLDELVPKYLPRIPRDPITGSATTWQLVTEESVQPSSDFSTTATAKTAPAQNAPVVIDIRSGAGAPYSSY
jgi:general secretion pathway protein G